jgi:hypothetical protein
MMRIGPQAKICLHGLISMGDILAVMAGIAPQVLSNFHQPEKCGILLGAT